MSYGSQCVKVFNYKKLEGLDLVLKKIKYDFTALYNTHTKIDDLKKCISDRDFFECPHNITPQEQSKRIDRIIGFKIPKIESLLLQKNAAYYKKLTRVVLKEESQKSQTWIGLHPQVLLTPYSEILEFIDIIKTFGPETLIDLGSAYGRMGFVLNSILPEVKFLGLELLSERVKEANRMYERFGLVNGQVLQADILDDDFIIPEADVYFIYDFSNMLDLRKLLRILSMRIKTDQFLLVARGEGCNSLIQYRFPEFWCANGVIKRDKFCVYSSQRALSA